MRTSPPRILSKRGSVEMRARYTGSSSGGTGIGGWEGWGNDRMNGMDRMVGSRVVLFEFEYEFEFEFEYLPPGCPRTPASLSSSSPRPCAAAGEFPALSCFREIGWPWGSGAPGSVAPPGLGSVLVGTPTAHAVGYRLAVLRTWSHGSGGKAFAGWGQRTTRGLRFHPSRMTAAASAIDYSPLRPLRCCGRNRAGWGHPAVHPEAQREGWMGTSQKVRAARWLMPFRRRDWFQRSESR